ncbi:MAG: hypothetical protein ACKO37_04260, partial [Vampirovibrionales bacterium]
MMMYRKLQKFVYPATQWMNTMSYLQKFGAVLVVFGFVVVPPFMNFYQETSKELAFTAQELQGTKFLQQLNKLTEHVSSHQSDAAKALVETMEKNNDVDRDPLSMASSLGAMKSSLTSGTPYQQTQKLLNTYDELMMRSNLLLEPAKSSHLLVYITGN